MGNIKIVTDSTTDLTEQEIEKYNITVVPLNSLIEGQSYIDGVTISRPEFLVKMLGSKELPKSSQPALGLFVETYEKLTEDGSEVLSIHLTESFSGTVNTAIQASEMVVGNVTAIDSKYVARSAAFQVLEAAKLAEKGLSLDEILKELEVIREKTELFVSVVHLENIIKGGRISHFMGGISTLLNLKLNFQFIEGKLTVLNKVRGSKAVVKHYSEVINSYKDKNVKAIGFTHDGLSVHGIKVLNELKETFPNAELEVFYASSPIMVHAGKDAFSVQFLVD